MAESWKWQHFREGYVGSTDDDDDLGMFTGAVGGRPDVLLNSSTPLPPYSSHSPKPPTAPKPKPSVDKKPTVVKQIKFSDSSDTSVSVSSTLPLEGTSSSFGGSSTAESEDRASPLTGRGKSPNKRAL